MTVKITHFKQGDGGWYLLFTGQQDDWSYVKDLLKSYSRGPYKNVWFSSRYKWPNRSKTGAWWVSSETMVKVAYLFSNLVEMLERAVDEDGGREGLPDWDDLPMYDDTPEPSPPVAPVKLPVTLQEAFSLLKLPMTTDKNAIKSKYRVMAFASHPDRGGSEERMKELNVAHDLIIKWVSRCAS